MKNFESENTHLRIAPGTCIDGRYDLLSPLGAGGMGFVYKAKHRVLGSLCAIKFLNPGRSTAEDHKRFLLEAKATSLLHHPNIVSVHDYGMAYANQPYIVMEFADGPTLESTLTQNGPLTAERFCKIFTQVCDALAHAHERNLIHRDIKPGNIVLTTRGYQADFVKILDFGLAKLMPKAELSSPDLTRTGEVFGSPLYMSPEQCMKMPLDGRSDIYSLGCTMFRALTGSLPFDGDSILQVMRKQIQDNPSFQSNSQANASLQKIILKCLSKDPSRRYQSAAELQKAIEKVGADLERTVLQIAPASRSNSFVPWQHIDQGWSLMKSKLRRLHKGWTRPILRSVIGTVLVTVAAMALRSTGLYAQQTSLGTFGLGSFMEAAGPGVATDLAGSPQALVMQGTHLMEQNRIIEAISSFNRAIAIDISNKDATKGRADAYYALRQYGKAIDDYSRLLAREPDSASLHLARGEAFLHANEFEKTISDLLAATRIEPSNSRLYLTLAEAYAAAGRHQDSLNIYNRAIDLGANDPATLRNRDRQKQLSRSRFTLATSSASHH